MAWFDIKISSKTWVLLLAVILIILNIIAFLYSSHAPYYNHIELSEDNFVKNETKMPYLDTVILVGLRKQNVKGVSVVVRPLSEEIIQKYSYENGLDLEAAIIGNQNQFVIYVSDMDRRECIVPIAHELIHLSQYHSGEFKILSDKLIKWNDVVLSDSIIKTIPYEQRQWEQIAFQLEQPLSRSIQTDLY